MSSRILTQTNIFFSERWGGGVKEETFVLFLWSFCIIHKKNNFISFKPRFSFNQILKSIWWTGLVWFGLVWFGGTKIPLFWIKIKTQLWTLKFILKFYNLIKFPPPPSSYFKPLTIWSFNAICWSSCHHSLWRVMT